VRIKTGTVQEDRTAYGNRFYIQIEDTQTNDNSDLRDLVGKEITVVIGETQPTAFNAAKESLK
jgi:hypothetical protein